MGVIRFWGVFFGLAVAAAAGAPPGPAAAQTQNCGTLATGTSYGLGSYNGITHATATSHVTITVPGRTQGQTVNVGSQFGSGILIRVQNSSSQRNIAATVGGTGTLQINQTGSLAASVWANGRGILFVRRAGGGSTVKANINSGVTIGTSSTRMNAHGIALQRSTLGRAGGAGDSCISSAARVYATQDGIHMDNIGSTGAVTLHNTGAITAGNRGIYVLNPDTGNKSVTVTNSGAIETTTANKRGIEVSNNGSGSDTAVTVTNSGAIGTATNRVGDGIAVVQQRGSGAVAVTNSGAILATGYGVQAVTYGDSSADLTVNLTGGSIATNGIRAGVSATAQGTGDIAISVSSGVSVTSMHDAAVTGRSWHASNTTGTVGVTQAGTLSGRHGVEILFNRHSAAMETRAASAQPMIDVTWTGTFAAGTGTATSDAGRRSVNGVQAAVSATRDTDVEAATRYGEAAGVEAYVLDRNSVKAQVTVGDDPGVIADAAAQGNLLSETHADSRRAEIIARLRAALTNEEIGGTIPGASAIDADSDNEYSDAELVTYLSADNTATRSLIRNILSVSLSEKETAVLKAVTTGVGLDAALDDADAGFSATYKTAVRGLLDRFNVGNIRISLNDGSIDSRGDGVRAYYVTPHNDNGRIDVTIAGGVTVEGGVSGIYVANAGMEEVTAASALGQSLLLAADATLRGQFVTVNGTVTGGTDAAVRLSGGGGLIVGRDGEIGAGSSGQAILVDAPGRSEIVIHGEVEGGAGADAAVEAIGGGSVTVGATGSVAANGAVDAVRARFAAADDGNGRIDLTVAEGGSVTGGGLYLANAGMAPVTAASAWGRALMLDATTDTTNLRQQFVEVHGTVTGGTDAAVHLVGGGALLVGATGRLVAGSSGRAILVNDPGRAEIVIHGRVEGGDGAPAAVDMTGSGTVTVTRTGSVRANGADYAIVARRTFGAAGATRVVVHVPGDTRVASRVSREAVDAVEENRVQGGFAGDGFENGEVVFLPTDDDGPTGHSPVTVRLAADGGLDKSDLTQAAPPAAEEMPAPGEMTPGEDETPPSAGAPDPVDPAPTPPPSAGAPDPVDPAPTPPPSAGAPGPVDPAPTPPTPGAQPARSMFHCDMRSNGRCILTVSRGEIVTGERRGVYADATMRIDVTVAEGARVTGGETGVYTENAGMGSVAGWAGARYLRRTTRSMTTENLRQQFVTVHGMVTGGTDAAVHLSGGGALLVGATGRLLAGSSGRAILVNDPGRSEIVIHGRVEGGAGAAGADDVAAIDVTGGGTVVVGETGRVLANGADYAVLARRASADDTRTTQVVYLVDGAITREAAGAAVARVDGAIGGDGVAERAIIAAVDASGTTGMEESAPIVNGRPDVTGLPSRSGGDTRPAPPFNCDTAMDTDDRCRLYSALPSVLLEMNGLPTWEERLQAARSEAGGWARVEASRGDWEADSSTRAEVAYDRRRSGVRVGVDGPVGDTGRLGVSVHALQGAADMTRGGGKIELSGIGASVSGTAFVAGGAMYIDAQAAATRYEAKLTSQLGTVLKDGASGAGYALALEAGRPVPLAGGAVTVTPRAGLAWSQVSMNDFADSRLATLVSVEEATSLLGRAGLGVAFEPGAGGRLRVVGSAEATHELSGETETRVHGVPLKASPEATGARVSLGAVHGWGEGRFALQALTTYAFGGAAGDGFEGGLSFAMRF